MENRRIRKRNHGVARATPLVACGTPRGFPNRRIDEDVEREVTPFKITRYDKAPKG